MISRSRRRRSQPGLVPPSVLSGKWWATTSAACSRTSTVMLAFVVNRLQEAHPGRWRTPAGIGVRPGKVTSKPKVGKIEKITTPTAARRQAFALFGARPDHPGADTTTAPGTVSPAQ